MDVHSKATLLTSRVSPSQCWWIGPWGQIERCGSVREGVSLSANVRNVPACMDVHFRCNWTSVSSPDQTSAYIEPHGALPLVLPASSPGQEDVGWLCCNRRPPTLSTSLGGQFSSVFDAGNTPTTCRSGHWPEVDFTCWMMWIPVMKERSVWTNLCHFFDEAFSMAFCLSKSNPGVVPSFAVLAQVVHHECAGAAEACAACVALQLPRLILLKQLRVTSTRQRHHVIKEGRRQAAQATLQGSGCEIAFSTCRSDSLLLLSLASTPPFPLRCLPTPGQPRLLDSSLERSPAYWSQRTSGGSRLNAIFSVKRCSMAFLSILTGTMRYRDP